MKNEFGKTRVMVMLLCGVLLSGCDTGRECCDAQPHPVRPRLFAIDQPRVSAPRPAVAAHAFVAAEAVPASGSAPYNGSPSDVMLEGFHWNSSASQNPNWYNIVLQNAQTIKDAGFTVIWLPPPSATADRQGYLPTRWYDLNSAYGSDVELKQTIAALHPAKVLADMVLNHRNGLSHED